LGEKEGSNIIVKRPVLITGCARSGTSMTAGVIDICGGWGGVMSGATPNNKKGMFENAEIRNKLVKPTLVKEKCDPKGQYPLPDISAFDKYSPVVWRDRVLGIMLNQGLGTEGTDKWYYKGAKMVLMWNLWHQAFPEATWIIVRRKDEDIINSCLKTGFMDAYQDEEGWGVWVEEHKKRFIQMYEAGLNIYEVYPQKMIDGNFEEMEAVIGCCGLNWKEQEVKEFIAPELWKGGLN
jgi:hypothetical protein